jgi:hypothetical protein
MGVRETVDARKKGVPYPWVSLGTDTDQADEEEQNPDIAACSDEKALVVSFGEPSKQ